MKNYPETADIETSSNDYASRFEGEVGTFFLQVQLATVLQLIEPYGNGTILDVGGGHAQLAVPLVKRGYDVTITGSDESCSERLKHSLTVDQYSYRTCNMLDLPFPDNSFDIVLAFRLVPHVDRWQALIKELSRVARKTVIIDYPDIRSSNILNFLLFRLKKKLEGNTRPFGLFSRSQIASEFDKYGLKVEKFVPEFFLPMVIHRKLQSARFSQVSETLFRKTGLTQILGSPIVAHVSKQVDK